MNKVAAQIDGMDFFVGGRWFRSRMECVDFAENYIPVGYFQWFIYIFSYLQFVTGDTVLTADSQQDEVHADKVRKTKEGSIVISAFKKDMPPILGGFGEGNESAISLTAICTSDLRNSYDGVMGVYPRASKSLNYHRLKLNAVINR